MDNERNKHKTILVGDEELNTFIYLHLFLKNYNKSLFF